MKKTLYILLLIALSCKAQVNEPDINCYSQDIVNEIVDLYEVRVNYIIGYYNGKIDSIVNNSNQILIDSIQRLNHAVNMLLDESLNQRVTYFGDTASYGWANPDDYMIYISGKDSILNIQLLMNNKKQLYLEHLPNSIDITIVDSLNNEISKYTIDEL